MAQKTQGKQSLEKIKDEMIEELTRILIKTDLEERKNGEKIYVRKTSCYKDLIKFIKDYL